MILPELTHADTELTEAEAQAILYSWKVSEKGVSVLSKRSEMVLYLQQCRQLTPFPADYSPAVQELLFNDLPYIRMEQGVLYPLRPCSPDYKPLFWELQFDGELAVFVVDGECVIDRTQLMTNRAVREGLFSELAKVVGMRN